MNVLSYFNSKSNRQLILAAVIILLCMLQSLIAQAQDINSAVRIEIEFLEKTEISPRDMVSWLDIVNVKNPDLVLLQELKEIQIPFKENFSSTELADFIKKTLTEKETLKKKNPLFKLPQSMHLIKSKNHFSEEEILRKTRHYLQILCEGCTFQVQLANTQVLQAIKDWDLDFSNMKIQAQQLIPIFENKQKTMKWLQINTRFYAPVQVAAKNIFTNERIKNSDLVTKQMDITFQKNIVLKADEIVNKITSRNLSAGSPVVYTDLKKEPDIFKGQTLKAIFKSENLLIQTSVVSEESGRIGDIIRVKHQDTAKVFSAKVLDAENVSIK
ncbi:MAG: flagellar basal body P-ring formation chaperone FlgA [Pseudobdellovibrionaceae bacterium]